MARQIFIVDAHIVDANGTFNYLTNDYPKRFDSRSYGGDVDKAQKRAEGDFSEAWGAMCKVDTRQVQVVMLMTADGQVIEVKKMGKFPEEPEPNAE